MQYCEPLGSFDGDADVAGQDSVQTASGSIRLIRLSQILYVIVIGPELGRPFVYNVPLWKFAEGFLKSDSHLALTLIEGLRTKLYHQLITDHEGPFKLTT